MAAMDELKLWLIVDRKVVDYGSDIAWFALRSPFIALYFILSIPLAI